MRSDVITVDLNGPLDEAQLAEIEQKTNQKIWENSEDKDHISYRDELEKIDYRSKKELTGQVRIVGFPGVGSLCMLRNSCDTYRRDRNGQTSFSGKIS